MFMVDSRRIELAGACYDPGSMLCTVGIRGAVDYTVVNGKVTVKDGRICTIDEADLSAAAGRKIRQYLGK